MEPKIILVTGANRGLGLETAGRLAAMGHIVYLGVRHEEKGRQAALRLNSPTEAIPLVVDLDNETTFTQAFHTIQQRHGRLDVLINNAGIMEEDLMKDSTATTSTRQLQRSFGTNFFGTVALTNTLLPLLLQSPAPRIVNVSTNMGSLSLLAGGAPLPKTFAYNASKTALNSYTIHLAQAYRHTDLKVNAAHPGWVKTDMGTPYAPMDVAEGVETALWLALLPADGPTGGFFHKKEPVAW